MKRLLIWGASDQGIVTLDCALAMQQYGQIDFLDMKEKGHRLISGYTVWEEEKVRVEELATWYDEVIVAVGSNELREVKTKRLTALGMPLAAIIHPSAIISPSAQIEEGCIIMPSAVVNCQARVAAGCIVNTQAIIEHDCQVEEFVNFCPKAAIAGRTRVGRKAFLGIGCSVIDGIQIGQEAVIGAGAVVIRDVPAAATVVGVPARIK